MKFDIECGAHRGTVEAGTIYLAWKKLTGNKRAGFSPLVRYRAHRGIARAIWFYITPQALDCGRQKN